MSRLARSARGAVIAVLLGGGAAAYYTTREVLPRQARRVEAEEAKRLFHFGRDHVVSGNLRVGGSTVAFVREGEQFVLTEPVAWPANQEAIAALLDRMATVRIERAFEEAVSDEQRREWGLRPPRIRAELELEDGRRPVLLVGALNPIVNGYPVQAEGGDRVGLAAADFHWAFDRPPDEFRDLHPVPEDPSRVKRVTVRTASTSYGLERDDEGAWWLAFEGGRRRASRRRAGQLLLAVTRRLEASRFATDDLQSSELATYGLEHPLAELRLEPEEGSAVELVFGRVGDAVFAWRKSTSTVVEVDPLVAAELRYQPEDLFDRTLSRVDTMDVARIEARLGTEAPFVLIRTDRGWALEGENDAAVEAFRVNAWVRRLGLLEGTDIHAEAPSEAQLEAWLLEPPSRRFVLKNEEGGVLADVSFGNLYDEKHILARRADRAPVLRVPVDRLGSIPVTRADLTGEP